MTDKPQVQISDADLGKALRKFKAEFDQWGGMRTNKGKPKPFEIIRHRLKTVVTPVVKAAFSDYDEAKEAMEALPVEASLRAAIEALHALGWRKVEEKNGG